MPLSCETSAHARDSDHCSRTLGTWVGQLWTGWGRVRSELVMELELGAGEFLVRDHAVLVRVLVVEDARHVPLVLFLPALVVHGRELGLGLSLHVRRHLCARQLLVAIRIDVRERVGVVRWVPDVQHLHFVCQGAIACKTQIYNSWVEVPAPANLAFSVKIV